MKRTEKEKLELLLQKVNLNKISSEELNDVFERIRKEQRKKEIQKQIESLNKELESL